MLVYIIDSPLKSRQHRWANQEEVSVEDEISSVMDSRHKLEKVKELL